MGRRPPAYSGNGLPPANRITESTFWGCTINSIYPEHERGAWIKAQRPPRLELDPFKPHGFFLEKECSASGQILTSATVLLTNRECSWRCLMCDLWKNTLPYSVPVGAIPTQIQYALQELGDRPAQIKLYNSGSFFDSAAIPLADYPLIAKQLSMVKHVVVESHPRLVGSRALRFRDLCGGGLEVAMGLETVHPEVLERLNKKVKLADFASAASLLRSEGICVRAFVLLKPPFMNENEGLEWAVKSAEFAFRCGATVVSLIPTRAGNGAMDRLQEAGEFSPPRLATLEQAMAAALELRGGRVFADLWNLEQFSNCAACFQQRRARLDAMNLSQQILPPINCSQCRAI